MVEVKNWLKVSSWKIVVLMCDICKQEWVAVSMYDFCYVCVC
jgi:hypothetical protein